MKFIIDRFEGDFAVLELENKTFQIISKGLLPEEANEGDVIQISMDTKETAKLQKEIKELADELWE